MTPNDEPHDEDDTFPTNAQQAAGGILAAALGISLVPHLGTTSATLLAAGLQPGAISAARNVSREWMTARATRHIRACEVAANEAGLEGDEIGDIARATPGMIDLAGAVGAAAENARYQAKVEALGRALGAALADPDPATMDAAFLRVAAVTDLEPVHVRMLHLIANGPPPGHPMHESGEMAGMLLDSDLFEAFIPGTGRYVGNLLAVLTRHNLVLLDQQPRYPGVSVTPFGREILDLLGQKRWNQVGLDLFTSSAAGRQS